MRSTEREPRTRALMYTLIVGLLLTYAIFKAHHIQVAMEAYRHQPLAVDTSQAAK
ncbi:MAG: hypothetical protein AAGE18_07570 [Pseudomonadota bacterium]